MIWLSGKILPDAHIRGIGTIITPSSYRPRAFCPAAPYAVDNGCFADPEGFRLASYRVFLNELAAEHGPGLFATLPDVYGDGLATFQRAAPCCGPIWDIGWRPALVLQPGMKVGALRLEQDGLGAVFLGGPDEWQRSSEALELVEEAKARGMWTHRGRVNTARRILTTASMGFDSADGTTLARGVRIKWREISAAVSQAAGLALEEAS